ARFDTHFRDEDGFIEVAQLQQYVDNETEVYICGGDSFLKAMISELQTIGIPMDNIHFETFIPRLSFSA
ncbi:MAG: globin domain-containing protein, partial [Staphylococcus equorum]